MLRDTSLLCVVRAVLFSVLATNFGAANGAERPNIIYIMADDLGYGDLQCYGQQIIQTPHIDQLAREGIRFTDHYAGHTVCRPSRLVLWSGQHVGHTGLIGNAAHRLSGRESTVAKLLQDDGYATGGVGKWALGHVNEPSEIDNPGHPNRNGFDYWFGFMNQSNAHNYYPTFLWENKTKVVLPGNQIDPIPRGRGRVSSEQVTYAHDEMTDAALKFIESNHHQPFLLHIHWTIPHANNEAGRVRGDGMEVPNYGPYQDHDWPTPEKGFAAMITHMDRDVGRLMALLKELQIDEETMVFFTSDNGPHHEGGHDHEFFNSNGPLQGFKRSMHEGGIRVPLIVRWPGRIKAGSVSDHPSAAWDFLPTACEISDVSPPADLQADGISYLSTLLGKDAEQHRHDYLYWASSEGKTSVGVRDGKWKLVRYRQDKGDGRGDWRLYDLSSDIGETMDLALKHPDVVRSIQAKLTRDGLLK